MSKKSYRYLILAFVFCLVSVLALRLFGLGEKPVHHDETINGWFVMQMWARGFFKYDPANYHGPLLFYLFQWDEIIFGSSIEAMRALTSFFSALTVILFLAVGWLKGRSTFVAGACVLAISPAAEFFGRSAIHESVFVFFMALMLFSVFAEATVLWMLAGFVGMTLLKETWALWLLSGALAFLLSGAWKIPDVSKGIQRLRTDKGEQNKIFKSFGVGIFVVALFYSGFFQNWEGLVDFFQAFLPWTKTGVGGAGHEKPWWTWVHWLSLYEIPTLTMAGLSVAGIFLADRKIKFYCWLSLLHLLFYSVIPYKTPWCLLSVQLPLVFSGVLSLENILAKISTSKKNLVLVAVSVLGLVHWSQFRALTWDSPIQLDHPYVYVQTQYDIKFFIEHLERAQNSLSLQKIQVATTETWPFPWLLRKFPKVVYGNSKSEPDKEAAVILFDEDQATRIRPLLNETHWERTLPVRQSRAPAVLFLRKDVVEQVGVF